MTGRHVHVRDAVGRLVYTRLIDDGTNVIRFADGGGFVARDEMEHRRWRILPGWPMTRHNTGDDPCVERIKNT